jgi:tetratricopeptide (TPR) repeat protein/DNA-directed RNA polymerase subunit RPC12/RpoP
MVGYNSPFVASPKAIEVLEQISLLTEIDANYLYIVEKVNDRSKLPIYSDIKGLERRFIEIAPGVIHELIKAGKIEEKKIDIAMDELENTFKSGTVGYYAVLLVITAYILEKVREKGYPADVSMVYSQIDAMGSDSPDEVVGTFGGDLDRTIESYETAVRTLGEIGSNELAEKRLRLAFLYDKAGRKDEALEQLREVIAHKPDYATAHFNLGALLYDLKQYNEAEEAWRVAIRVDPDDAAAHANLGTLLSASDRKEEAIQEFNTALNLKDQLMDKGEKIIQELESLNINIGDNNKIGGDVVGGDNYKLGGDFIVGDKNIGMCSKTYRVGKQNVFIEKLIAPPLIKKYGRKKVGIIGAISIIAGLITVLTWLNSTPIGKIISYLPAFPESVSYWVLGFGFILLLIGSILLMVINYYSSTKCAKCGKDFAYEESEYPVRHDTDTKEGTWRTVTSTYKCKYCGHEVEKKSPPYLVKDEAQKF